MTEPSSSSSTSNSEKLIDTSASTSESIKVSEDILNVIQSGQVKTSTSNKLSLLMDSSDEEEEIKPIRKPVNKKLTAGKRMIYSKDTDQNEYEERDENGFLSDGYDINLFGDSEDRATLEAMNEVEREAILYERAQLRQARQERRALEQKIREREDSASGGRRAPTATADIKRKKLDELKAKRQKKLSSGGAEDDDEEEEEGEFEDGEEEEEESEESEEEERERERRARKQKQQSRRNRRRRSEESDEDFYTESEEEQVTKKSAIKRKGELVEIEDDLAAAAAADATPLDLDCANKLRLSRDILSEWIYRDGFEDIVQKCFLRINLGPGKNGQPTYRLVELKKIVDFHHTYLIKAGIPTNLAALVKFAKSERTFRFEFVSNSPFTEAEFQHWKFECEKAGVKLPYNSVSAKRKIEKLKAFYQQPLTDSIVALMLDRKKKLQDAQSAPRNLLAEQTILQQQLREAHELSNDDEVIRIESELAAISQRKDISANRREDRLAVMDDLNRRNRLVNLETGRQAEISRMQFESGLLLESAKNSGNNSQNVNVKTLDPFQRRKCKPTVIHLNDESSEVQVASSDVKDKDEEEVKLDSTSEPTISASVNTNTKAPAKSLYDAHDFDLDLDI